MVSKLKFLLGLILVLAAGTVVSAQTSLTGRITIGPAASRPALCTSGDVYEDSDDQNNWRCFPANTWIAFGVGATSPVNSPSPFIFNVDLQPIGPNPYVDGRGYHIRAVNPNVAPAVSGVNCNTTASSPTITISLASTFQNNDGIVCVNAGAANGLGSVSAPTVTPFNMRAGTGTGDGVAAPAGSTSFSYKVFACDVGGGCTAPSSAGSTTTGNALGSQTVTVTSATRSNDTLTYNTSSQIGASVGAVAILSGFSTPDNVAGFGGTWCLITTVSAGNFTCANTPLDTREGAATVSAGGGTATIFNYNKVTWTAVTGSPYRYFVCNGSGTLLGPARLPVNPKSSTFTDGTLEFDDFGPTMMSKSASAVPWYVSNANCTGSATNDNWVTTIASGAGTTTLTASGNAPNSNGGGKTIRFDNTPNLIAAATANPNTAVELPFTLNTASYVFNSVVDFSNNSFGPLLTPSGAIFNDTILLGANSQWYGDRLPGNGSNTQFQSYSIPFVFTSGTPGVFNTNGFGGIVKALAFTGPDNGITFLQDGGGGSLGATYTDNQFLTTADSNDYMGMAFVCRGGAGESCTGAFDGKTLVFSGTQGMGSLSATPAFFCDNCGFFKIKDLMGSSRALAFFGGDGSGSGAGLFSIEHGDWQGGSTPFVLASAKFGNGGVISLGVSGEIELDTMAQPCVVTLVPTSSTTISGCFPSSGVPQISGVRVPSNAAFAQNRDNTTSVFSSAHDGTLDAGAGVNYLSNTTNGAISTGTSYPIFISGTVPSLNSCPVSSGGSVPTGSRSLQIVPQWWDGSQGIPSNACAATTSSGNQTITLSWTAIPGNPKAIYIYDNLVRQTTNLGASLPGNATSAVITTEGFTGSVLAAIPLGGPTMLLPGAQGIATPQITLSSTGGFAATISGVFTAARNITQPDASGTDMLYSGTFNPGDCPKSFGTGAQTTFISAGPCLTGTVNSAPQFSVTYYSGAGTSAILNGVANGITGQIFTSTNGAAPSFQSPGIPGRVVSGTSDTILCDSGTTIRDRASLIQYTSGSAVSVTLPQAGLSGCGANFTFGVFVTGAGNVTVSPTVSLITSLNGYSASSAVSSLIIPTGSFCTISSPDNNNYIARCSGLTQPIYYAADSGVANAYVVSPTFPILALTTGVQVSFTTTRANTGASTVNVSGLGVKNLTKQGTTALATGDILSGAVYLIEYDGTEWQLVSGTGSGGGSSGTVTSVDGSGSNGVQTLQGGAIAAITTNGTVQASQVVNSQTGTSYTILTSDRGKVIVQSNVAAIADTLPQATSGAASTFGPGWFVDIYNSGSTIVTVTPTTSTINGKASLQVNGGQWAHITSDGTNYDSWTTNGAPSAVNTSAVTVNAAVTTDQTLQEVSLPAGYLNLLNQPFWVHGSGIFSTAAAQTPTLNYKVKLCTVSGCGSGTVVTLATITSGNTVASISNNNWALNLLAVTNGTGGSGTLLVHSNPGLSLDLQVSSSGSGTVYGDTNIASSSTIDLTKALFVDFTVATSTGNTGNSITQQVGAVMPQSNPAGNNTTFPLAFINNSTGLSTGIGTTTLATGPPPGTYILRYYADQSAVCTTGSNSVNFTFNWTDASNARTLVTGSLVLGTSQSTTGYLSGVFPIFVGSGNFTYSSTVSGSCASGTSNYDFHVTLERTQ